LNGLFIEKELRMATTTVRVVGPRDGKLGILGGIGIRFMVGGEESGGGFALVEHPMEPHALAAPMHRHSREDEYSFVLEGRVGADLGGEVVYAETGDLIFKPRGQWHTFWNAGDGPARILEIISPAGFEKFFEKITELAARGELLPSTMATLAAEYGAEVDMDSVPKLVATHGLEFGPAHE
jgi:quercetin dioxygenase-like cupin family protein